MSGRKRRPACIRLGSSWGHVTKKARFFTQPGSHRHKGRYGDTERLAQQLPGLFIALDRRHRVVVWNDECARLTGWTAAEVQCDVGHLFPDPKYRTQIAAEWDALSLLPVYHDWEWRVTCRDGAQRTLSWSSCHIFTSLSPWYVRTRTQCSTDCNQQKGEKKKQKLINFFPYEMQEQLGDGAGCYR
jgi:PAS domain-containing protein